MAKENRKPTTTTTAKRKENKNLYKTNCETRITVKLVYIIQQEQVRFYCVCVCLQIK